MNMIQPRNIQISKELTVKDLKDKIIRCVNHYLYGDKEMHLKEIKLYLKNFGMRSKKEAFELIYSYYSKDKIFKIIAEEIKNDDIKIEVSI